MSFNDNFTRICEEHGTTRTTLLKKMGVAPSKVSLWGGGSLPKEDMLIRLAKELDCSVMDFFADEEDIAAPKTVPANEDEEDILRVYRLLPRRVKHEFMTMVYEFESKAELEGDKGNSAAG